MRRQVSVGILASILLYGPICIAQTPSPPPSTVPASLLVPDRFVRAVKNQSTAPSFLMVTIINDTTGETKRVCIESIQLFGAVRTENQWGRGRQGWGKTRELLLNNASHTFHFKNKDAWAQVQPRYSPQMLAAVEEEFRPLSTTELAARFDYDKTSGIVPIDENTPPEKIFDYCAAAAYVLTERGLLVGRGDFGNSLYVITPAMLAEEDALEKNLCRRKEAQCR